LLIQPIAKQVGTKIEAIEEVCAYRNKPCDKIDIYLLTQKGNRLL